MHEYGSNQLGRLMSSEIKDPSHVDSNYFFYTSDNGEIDGTVASIREVSPHEPNDIKLFTQVFKLYHSPDIIDHINLATLPTSVDDFVNMFRENNNMHLIIAETSDRKVAGSYTVEEVDGTTVMLSRMVRHPNFKGKGTGDKLM